MFGSVGNAVMHVLAVVSLSMTPRLRQTFAVAAHVSQLCRVPSGPPQTLLRIATLQEIDTGAYDAWLEQLSEDTKQYVRAVFKTLVATVPKAIIHAQVLLLRISPWLCIVLRTFAHLCT